MVLVCVANVEAFTGAPYIRLSNFEVVGLHLGVSSPDNRSIALSESSPSVQTRTRTSSDSETRSDRDATASLVPTYTQGLTMAHLSEMDSLSRFLFPKSSLKFQSVRTSTGMLLEPVVEDM